MKIHAAVARAPHMPFSLERLDLEEPREGEILVRVVATGVCHTDIVMYGEPLVNKEIFKMIAYAKEKGVRITSMDKKFIGKKSAAAGGWGALRSCGKQLLQSGMYGTK